MNPSYELQEMQDDLISVIRAAQRSSHILSIVYDDYIKPNDIYYLLDTLEKVPIRNFTLLLHGPGGCTRTALLMAEKLGSTGKFTACVPRYCGSAMVYLLLRANMLLWLPTTRITQIDPHILDPRDELGETELRVVKGVNDEDPAIRTRCRQVFGQVRDKVIELLRSDPSLYNHRKDDFDFLLDGEKLVRVFMNKESHDSLVHYEELNELNYSVKLVTDDTLISLYGNIVKISLNILRAQNARFMIAWSEPYKDTESADKYHGIFFYK